MSEPNQKVVYLNRTKIDMSTGAKPWAAYNMEESYALLDDLTYTEFKVYHYLCGQNPNTINGKQNQKGPIGYYELSPKALHKVYPKTNAQTFTKAINGLIEKGVLKHCKGNVYSFDNRPLKYRVSSIDEYEEMEQISAEEAYKIHHKEELKERIELINQKN